MSHPFGQLIFYLKYVDNNDTVSYGCIGSATLVKGVRQIGIGFYKSMLISYLSSMSI